MQNQSVYRRALKLAVPIMIQNGITNAVGLVDHIMVGSIGTEAMTAVSIVGQLLFVFYLAIFGGLSGPGIYSAQFYGQGNTEGVRQSFRMKVLIAGTVTAAGILILRYGKHFLIGLYLHGESTEVDPVLTTSYAMQYLMIMLIGLPFNSLTQVYAGTLRETGDSFKPMIAGVVSVLTDVLLNYLLIYGKFGFPQLGVRGAAIATVIARLTEVSVLLIWSHAKASAHPFLKGIWKTLHIPGTVRKAMLKKSIPLFCNEFLWAGGLAALTQCYSTRGLHIVSGLNISNAICNLLNVVFVALGNAVGILIGQALGARKFEQAKRDSVSLTWFTAGICLILTAVLIAISGLFPRLYDTTETVRHAAKQFIIVTAIFFPVQGILNTLYFTLRSGGKTLVTFLFDSVFSWTFTVPFALVLCFLTKLPIIMVYVIVQSADLIKIAIGAVMIRKGIWISDIASEAS